MIPGVSSFCDVIGEKTANDFYDYLTKLLNKDSMSRSILLNDEVLPIFDSFKQVHSEYESAFKEYRSVLRKEEDCVLPNSQLFDSIRADLEFSGTQRVDLIAAVRASKGTVAEGLVLRIVEYLTSSVEDFQSGADNVLVQRHRNSLIADLETVTIDNSWDVTLDPHASKPPLRGEELQIELTRLRHKYSIDEKDPKWEVKVRQFLAVEILDNRHREIVEAYSKVVHEFEELKHELKR